MPGPRRRARIIPVVPDKKVSNSLVALGSAAVLAVYTAGYVRTKSAADRFSVQAAVRRPAIPAPPSAAPVVAAPVPAPILASPAKVVAPADAPKSPPRKVKKLRTVAPPTPAAEPAALSPVAPVPAPVVVPQPAVVVDQPGPSPAPEPPAPPKPVYKDGTYFGWGTSRHGDIQAQVIVQNGRIESATIAQCYTRYSCSVISKLPPQVADRQSPETDYVSGATQSTNAFYYAVVEALARAK
jgi:uncharacterized protein with FMN-binding domain